MSEKRVYISADYSEKDGDREVVEILNKWGKDQLHKVNFVDMAKVVSGSVEKDPDCRICDLKEEFNRQIAASSAVIFIVGDNTANRSAGCQCECWLNGPLVSECTPYKHNSGGKKKCKIWNYNKESTANINPVNYYSYLEHEFKEAEFLNKKIIILYNSTRKELNWLPSYMYNPKYRLLAAPFWIRNNKEEKVGNYQYIKNALGF